jgi:hypothetical protein
VGEGNRSQRTSSSVPPAPLHLLYTRSATGAHNHQLVGVPDQGARSNGPETWSHAVGCPLGSIQHRMLIGLGHHRPRHRRRRHKSSEAPASTPALAPGLLFVRSPAPAPLPPTSHRSLPHGNHNHIAPLRSMARRLGGGGQSRLPVAALAVIGACLLLLGAVGAAVCLIRSGRFKKGGSKPFKLFFHGSRAQGSPCATRKVSSHPSPDLLYLSSVVTQGHENYPIRIGPSESKGLSIVTTPSKSTELIISDYTVKTNSNLQSDEAESFHSLPCSRSSSGSIVEIPLQISNKTVIDQSRSSPDNSPSGSSYHSLSPDEGFQSPPKSPSFTAHFRVSSHCLPEKLDQQKTELNYQEAAKTTDNSGSANQPEVRQVISKFNNPPSEYYSSHYRDTIPSRTHAIFSVSNANVNLNPKVPSKSSTDGENFQTSNAAGVPKPPPPPPPPPNKPPQSLKGQNYGQPPLPPPLPLSVQVGKDGLPLPRLKPLHWDKVRAAPNRSMVWNDIQSSSFEFE